MSCNCAVDDMAGGRYELGRHVGQVIRGSIPDNSIARHPSSRCLVNLDSSVEKTGSHHR